MPNVSDKAYDCMFTIENKIQLIRINIDFILYNYFTIERLEKDSDLKMDTQRLRFNTYSFIGDYTKKYDSALNVYDTLINNSSFHINRSQYLNRLELLLTDIIDYLNQSIDVLSESEEYIKKIKK
jgi:hypothetical protein